MSRRNSPQNPGGRTPLSPGRAELSVRIIGGQFRGRLLAYSGDLRTRPMKDRVREALFNLLGDSVQGKIALDLFAGTGAIGLEAISRGAARAIFIERHFPTADLIWRNADLLAVRPQVEVCTGDTFLWPRRYGHWPALADRPWIVFCSPPFEFFVDRLDDMLGLLTDLKNRAPAGSLFAIEADRRFDFGLLADWGEWDIREYPPAVLGIGEASTD